MKNTSSKRAIETLTAELNSLDEDILEIRTNLRSKIEATAKELASLLRQAKDEAERPAPSFWKSLEPLGLLLNFTPAHLPPTPTKKGKKVTTANFPSKEVPVANHTKA